jgi:hypothetical protein
VAAYLTRQIQQRFSEFHESANSISHVQLATLISKLGSEAKLDK